MRLTLSIALLLATGCAADSPGAIFTTVRNGADANTYSDKGDVYLNGAPQQLHDSALPEGDYVFQVTDARTDTLLSTDDASCRAFHVDVGGRITAALGGACAHAWGNDVMRPPGNMTIQLMPYADARESRGEYKVWVMTADDFAAAGRFLPRFSMTDSFKIESGR